MREHRDHRGRSYVPITIFQRKKIFPSIKARIQNMNSGMHVTFSYRYSSGVTRPCWHTRWAGTERPSGKILRQVLFSAHWNVLLPYDRDCQVLTESKENQERKARREPRVLPAKLGLRFELLHNRHL